MEYKKQHRKITKNSCTDSQVAARTTITFLTITLRDPRPNLYTNTSDLESPLCKSEILSFPTAQKDTDIFASFNEIINPATTVQIFRARGATR